MAPRPLKHIAPASVADAVVSGRVVSYVVLLCGCVILVGEYAAAVDFQTFPKHESDWRTGSKNVSSLDCLVRLEKTIKTILGS